MLHMNTDTLASDFGPSFAKTPSTANAEVIIVCEHAANWIPTQLDALGLDDEVRQSHIAWDPGALGVARKLAELLQGPLIEGCISRLVYDLNRPPESPTAIPATSEIFDVPGNRDLSDAARAQRVEAVYEPFRAALAAEIAARSTRAKPARWNWGCCTAAMTALRRRCWRINPRACHGIRASMNPTAPATASPIRWICTVATMDC